MRQLKITHQITNRSQLSLEKYLSDVNKEGLITPEEEVVLAQKIKAGDKKALSKLINANLRFVISVAKQYQNNSYGLSLSDLINEGNLGLITAAKRFDETRGFKFISYAVWWIRQSIMKAISEQSRLVRLPVNRLHVVNQFKKTYSELEQKLEREPSSEELASLLNISTTEVNNIMKETAWHVSMDAPIRDDDGGTMYDVINDTNSLEPDKKLLRESLQDEIRETLEGLSAKESKVINLFYGLNDNPPMTLEEIGTKINISKERVRQLKAIALKKLQRRSKSTNLHEYLG